MKLNFKIQSFIFLLLILVSCGTAPSNFYLLSAANDYQVENSSSNDQIGIGIGNIELPDYLLKPQIAKYTSDNKIIYDEFNRWAEPLDENFARVMIENLSQMIPTNSIYLFMWPEDHVDVFQVNVKVDQFGLASDGSVILNARWSVSSKNVKSYWISQKSNYQERITEINYSQISSAMSSLIKSLSEDIAEEIKRKVK